MYLIERDMASAALVSFAAAELDRDACLALVRGLIEKKNFGLAFELWKKIQPSGAVTGANMIVDGDFESFTGDDAGGFGWQVGHNDRAKVEVAVTDRAGSSNSRGLEIRFNGDLDPGSPVISQLLPVRPKTGYELSFVSTSKDLVSAGLPIVSVMDASTSATIADSRVLNVAGLGWHVTNMSFDTSEKTEAIIIAVRRKGCQSSPCPIFGEIRLDDFVLKLRTTK